MSSDDDLTHACEAFKSSLQRIFPWLEAAERDNDPPSQFEDHVRRPPKAVILNERSLHGHFEEIEELIFKPIKGFHEGYLDLGGRHQDRYDQACEAARKLLLMLPEVPPLMDRFSAGELDVLKQIPLWCMDREQLNSVFKSVVEIPSCVAAHPTISIQKFLLTDLPVEILHLILEHCDTESARSLRFMSRSFNEVCRPYALREYTLEYPSAYVLPAHFRKDIRKYLRKYEFLCRDQQIIRFVRNLKISLFFVDNIPNRGEYSGNWNSTVLARTLATPLSVVLLHGSNIESLTLSSVYLDTPFMKRTLQLPRLRTLELENCSLDDEGDRCWSKCTSALNLSIRSMTLARRHTDLNANMFFIHMPSVCYFAHEGSLVDSRILFDIDAEHVASGASSVALFALERLEIVDPTFDEMGSLSGWFTQASEWVRDAQFRLTHFKLSRAAGMNTDDCVRIVNALRGAPIRCLSLENVLSIDVSIFAILATAFPDLEDLTLVYQDPGNQRNHSLPVTWPHLCQDYAPSFSAYTRLRNFAWNYRFQPSYMFSPVILAFETGWEVDVNPEDDDGRYYRCSYALDEWIFTFRLFAAYCPSLETLDFMHHAILRRCADGDITFDYYENRSQGARGRPWQTSLPTF